jgi:hypothetical protein
MDISDRPDLASVLGLILSYPSRATFLGMGTKYRCVPAIEEDPEHRLKDVIHVNAGFGSVGYLKPGGLLPSA